MSNVSVKYLTNWRHGLISSHILMDKYHYYIIVMYPFYTIYNWRINRSIDNCNLLRWGHDFLQYCIIPTLSLTVCNMWWSHIFDTLAFVSILEADGNSHMQWNASTGNGNSKWHCFIGFAGSTFKMIHSKYYTQTRCYIWFTG